MNSYMINSFSIFIFFLVLIAVSITKIVVPRKYNKAVIVAPLLLLIIPFVFGSGLGVYDKYLSPVMAGLVFSIFIEKWVEWLLFKINKGENNNDENKSILDNIINKKKINKEKEKSNKQEAKTKENIILKEQEERDLKRKQRRERREKK